MNSTADLYSELTGLELLRSKVSELVIMGGGYPSGHEFNFWGSNPHFTAHVVHNYPGRMVFVGVDIGMDVKTGGPLMSRGSKKDPVRMAYIYYGYYTLRPSWDPLTILYAVNGLGDLFAVEDDHGYNHIESNGTNRWIYDGHSRNQSYLRLKVDNEVAAADLDKLFLETAMKFDKTRERNSPEKFHHDL
jgi:inosine-uridine nucleoside N-ribohydrolase